MTGVNYILFLFAIYFIFNKIIPLAFVVGSGGSLIVPPVTNTIAHRKDKPRFFILVDIIM